MGYKMKLVWIVRNDDDSVLVNPEQIVHIQPSGDESIIRFSDGSVIYAKDNPERLKDRLNPIIKSFK